MPTICYHGGGVPAKVIKYRFDEDLIHKMMGIDYAKISTEEMMSHLDELYDDVTKDNITQLSWMIK